MKVFEWEVNFLTSSTWPGSGILEEMTKFWEGFFKQAEIAKEATTINDMIGNPFGKSSTPPPPPPPPPPAGNVGTGQTINSRIGNPFGN